MRYGVAFHHEYTWWWYQPAFGSDTALLKAGVPYDASQTLADGKGKWWEGYDPRLLYGIDLRAYKNVANVKFRPEQGIFYEHLDYAHWYATRWALRIMDVINKYDPDFIYTDGELDSARSAETRPALAISAMPLSASSLISITAPWRIAAKWTHSAS